MRDRTASRNYSPAADEFRREHKRHREWGLTRRHAERLRRNRDGSGALARPTPTGDVPEMRSALLTAVHSNLVEESQSGLTSAADAQADREGQFGAEPVVAAPEEADGVREKDDDGRDAERIKHPNSRRSAAGGLCRQATSRRPDRFGAPRTSGVQSSPILLRKRTVNWQPTSAP